jgi:diacylglycerol kinase (ATP)
MQDSCSSAVLYVSAKSRTGKESFDIAVEELKKQGVDLTESELFRDPDLLGRKVGGAAKRGTPLIIVGGGDGTLSLVARHFVNSESTLGILPLGTGNAFARDLSIPINVAEACKVIVEGKTEPIDLGYAGNDYFLNVVTVGLSVRIAQELKGAAKKRLGRAAYIFAMARALMQVKPFHAKLITPSQTLEFETLQVVVGNGRYHAGPFLLAEDATITEGKLSAYALATTNRAAFLKLAWAMRTGHQIDLPEVYSVSTASGRLETDPIRKVVVDGEIVLQTPVDFKVVPKAIRVRVPTDFAG